MRCLIILLPALLVATPAAAERIIVQKGAWTVTTDVYLTGEVFGEKLDEPVDTEIASECWSLDEDVELDESMLAIDGCATVGGVRTDYSIDLTLSCVIEGIEMDGSILMSTNVDRDMVAGRFLLVSREPDMNVRSEGIIMGRRTGACSGSN